MTINSMIWFLSCGDHYAKINRGHVADKKKYVSVFFLPLLVEPRVFVLLLFERAREFSTLNSMSW